VEELVSPQAQSFDWREYGQESAGQVSWGVEIRADLYDDLHQGEGVALFVDGVKVYEAGI